MADVEEWVAVADAADIAEGSVTGVNVAGVDVAIFRSTTVASAQRITSVRINMPGFRKGGSMTVSSNAPCMPASSTFAPAKAFASPLRRICRCSRPNCGVASYL